MNRGNNMLNRLIYARFMAASSNAALGEGRSPPSIASSYWRLVGLRDENPYVTSAPLSGTGVYIPVFPVSNHSRFRSLAGLSKASYVAKTVR
jgi:hypothetical protein